MNLPLELIDEIFSKLKSKVLMRIYGDNDFKSIFHVLNKKRIKNYWKKIGIHGIARKGYLNSVKYLLKTIDLDDYNLSVCINGASYSGKLDTVKYLVGLAIEREMKKNIEKNTDKKENINHRIYDYIMRSIVSASQSGQLHVLKYFMKFRPFPEHSQIIDISLSWAAKEGHLNTVKYLVEQGGNVAENNNDPIILASESGHIEMIKYLITMGADFRSRNDDPLIYACLKGKIDAVKYLISLGADIRAQDNDAIKSARKNGHLDVENYLESILYLD
jgi:hypothetical protein